MVFIRSITFVKTNSILLLSLLTLYGCAKKSETPTQQDTLVHLGAGETHSSNLPAPPPQTDASSEKSHKRLAASTPTPTGTLKPPSEVPADSEPKIEIIPEGSPLAKPPFPFPTAPTKRAHVDPDKNIPLGMMPIVSSKRLFELQPTIPGYVKDPQLVFKRDVPRVISKSVQVYRDLSDANHTIRVTIVDQNELAARRIIKDIGDFRLAGGERTQLTETGEPVTAYLVEFKDMVGASSYIASRKRSVLNLIVGDHRTIELIEEPAENRENLVEIAKKMDFDVQKFEHLR